MCVGPVARLSCIGGPYVCNARSPQALVHEQRYILGVSSDELYELLHELLYGRAISQNDLMEAVSHVDTDGAATRLVHSSAIATLWHTRRYESKVGRHFAERAADCRAGWERAAHRLTAAEAADAADGASTSFAEWYAPKVPTTR